VYGLLSTLKFVHKMSVCIKFVNGSVKHT